MNQTKVLFSKEEMELPKSFRLFWFFVKDRAKDQNALMNFWYSQKFDEVMEALEKIYEYSGLIPYELEKNVLLAAKEIAEKRGLCFNPCFGGCWS